MKAFKVGANYARAIYSVAVEEKSETRYFDELQALKQGLSGPLFELLQNPVFRQAERRNVLEEIATKLKLSDDVRAFFILVAEAGHLRALPTIVGHYRKALLDSEKKQLVTITTAVPLDSKQRREVVERFSELHGRRVEIEESVDAQLLGGAVFQIGSKTYDGSIRGRLSRLREMLASGQTSLVGSQTQ